MAQYQIILNNISNALPNQAPEDTKLKDSLIPRPNKVTNPKDKTIFETYNLL